MASRSDTMKITDYGKWTILLDEDACEICKIKGHFPTFQLFMKYPDARVLKIKTNGKDEQVLQPQRGYHEIK